MVFGNLELKGQKLAYTYVRRLTSSPKLPKMENGGTGRIRTSDLVIRNHLLYPAELRPRIFSDSYMHVQESHKDLRDAF